MGKQTGIEWAHATVNVWVPKPWDGDTRYETANWERKLRALNRKARREREKHLNSTASKPYARPRVFINSLSDTFEDWQGPVYRIENGKPVVVAQSLDDVRRRLFRVAEEGTELDILLLTKRPENVLRMVPRHWHTSPQIHENGMLGQNIAKWPPHVWLGTTVEDQEHADKRIPELLKAPAKVRFLSVEPLLGKVDLRDHIFFMSIDTWRPVKSEIHWVIVGGESGTNARPMGPEWVRTIRDHCVAAGVPFFFKTWGEWYPCSAHEDGSISFELGPKTGLGRVPAKPLIQRFNEGVGVMRVGKKNAGRVVDGHTWDEVPK